jgi:hypothetical protein
MAGLVRRAAASRPPFSFMGGFEFQAPLLVRQRRRRVKKRLKIESIFAVSDHKN